MANTKKNYDLRITLISEAIRLFKKNINENPFEWAESKYLSLLKEDPSDPKAANKAAKSISRGFRDLLLKQHINLNIDYQKLSRMYGKKFSSPESIEAEYHKLRLGMGNPAENPIAKKIEQQFKVKCFHAEKESELHELFHYELDKGLVTHYGASNTTFGLVYFGQDILNAIKNYQPSIELEKLIRKNHQDGVGVFRPGLGNFSAKVTDVQKSISDEDILRLRNQNYNAPSSKLVTQLNERLGLNVSYQFSPPAFIDIRSKSYKEVQDMKNYHKQSDSFSDTFGEKEDWPNGIPHTFLWSVGRNLDQSSGDIQDNHQVGHFINYYHMLSQGLFDKKINFTPVTAEILGNFYKHSEPFGSILRGNALKELYQKYEDKVELSSEEMVSLINHRYIGVKIKHAQQISENYSKNYSKNKGHGLGSCVIVGDKPNKIKSITKILEMGKTQNKPLVNNIFVLDENLNKIGHELGMSSA